MARCVVAGASGGIGRAICAELAAFGHEVVSCARRSVDVPDKFAGVWTHYQVDLASEGHARAFSESVLKESCQVDALVNCVGLPVFGPVISVSEEEFASSLSINLLVHYRLVRQFLAPMLAQRSGVIIAIESVASTRSLPFASAYCAAKAGMAALSESLRLEVRKLGVRVVQLQLGLVDTAFLHGLTGEKPCGGNGIRPEAIARLARLAIEDEHSEFSQIVLRPAQIESIDHFVNILNKKYQNCYETFA